jgi:hypothetical protein
VPSFARQSAPHRSSLVTRRLLPADPTSSRG